MAYLMINNVDYSKYVNELTVAKTANYNAQTNAAGNTVVDYINTKRVITVGFIPLSDASMKTIMSAINAFNVSITYLNPDTGALEKIDNCIVPDSVTQYYSIRVNNVLFNAFTVDFIEL